MKKLLIFISLLLTMAFGVIYPLFIKAQNNAHKARGINNLKSMGIALGEFENHYGQYPQPEIPELLREAYPQTDRLDSNYVLGQVIVADATDSEKLFDAFLSKGPGADDDISLFSEILRPGECAYIYVSGAGGEAFKAATTLGAVPLLISPADPNGKRVDLTAYLGEYLCLRSDRSVGTGLVSPEGVPLLKNGKSLFDYGPDTVWGDKKPRVHDPLPYERKSDRHQFLLSYLRWPCILIPLGLMIYRISQWRIAPLNRAKE
ncbi:hypothetical protein OAG53_01905 [Akkermansiaceae bacterium]|nr:hypothetical protein [Akkermansiaceae bacterium]